MSYPTAEDLLIYVGIPLAVIAIIFALVYVSSTRAAKRYRPGRPYTYAPVWFLAKPEISGPSSAGADVAAITGAPHPGVTGGASDRW